jgi:purine nucleosidase
LDHDGGIDDFITLLLLLSQPKVELIGIIALGADSIPSIAVNTTLKLLDLLEAASQVPVALSTLPAVNPFPLHWRWQGSRVDVLPLLNQRPPKQKLVEEPGQDFLLHLLQEQEEPIDIVATGQYLTTASCRRRCQ